MSSTCLPTIRGSCMVRRSSRIRAGIPYPGFFGVASDSRSVLDLELASSEDLDGAGATGDTTGVAVGQCTTITPSSRTAEPLIAADLITLTSAAGASATVTPSTVPAEARGSADLLRRTFSPGHARAPSAALITAEMRADFPRAGDPASVVVRMAAS